MRIRELNDRDDVRGAALEELTRTDLEVVYGDERDVALTRRLFELGMNVAAREASGAGPTGVACHSSVGAVSS